MDTSRVTVLWNEGSKALGKVRRRVQDLHIPSSYYYEFATIRSTLDLSHNESARLAVDSLLSQGLEGYHKVLNAEGEVDFLSELEKNYILENGTDGYTGCTYVKWTDPVPGQPSLEVYFQSDSRTASMKDLVREFIRKAKMTLAIVMDSFSDVELLCDLLEASRKRNVYVHLLLDHLNLNLFQELPCESVHLLSIHLSKLSVRSVDGQTYCAKTGRKLTGQIAESFIITDWTEVLTGSYSFSWLSWQVHRSLAILVKGSALTPFHQEFHRLYSSSSPVPGFVTSITVPPTLPLYTSHTAQNDNTGINKSKSSQTNTTCHRAWTEDAQTKAKMMVILSPQSSEQECSKCDNQHRADIGAQKHTKPPQLYLKPLVQPGTLQSVSVEKHTAGSVSTQHDVQTYVGPLEKSKTQIQSASNPLGQNHSSYIQSQLVGLTISTAAEKNARGQVSSPLHTDHPSHGLHSALRYQPPLKKDSDLAQAAIKRVYFGQKIGNGLTKTSWTAAGLNTQREQWNYSLNLKPKVELQSNNPKLLSNCTYQTGLQVPCGHFRGQTSGLETKVYSLGSRRQDRCLRHHQPLHQSHPTIGTPRLKSASASTGALFNPQLYMDSSKMFLPGTRCRVHPQAYTSQQVKPPPRLNWMSHCHMARPRPMARSSSFASTYEMVQKSWAPCHSNMTS
uniref:Scaffolding anchor of CK1 domain-containing protein n=1 Tax=Monopterus albus TaxID=43700 RepID=A0A3Q3Q6B9_MONAL